ncbi:MAG: hypothetical protein KUG78_12040 [Kangiellaceae bacterium]|nr:hypothetical protein [Kangiellaceae bacterium]
MKIKIAASILALSVAAGAHAGVKDKKAIRAADAAITAAAANTQAACGNKTLAVTVNWDQFKTMFSSNAAELKKRNEKLVWVLSHAGQRTVASLESMAKICNDDPDYKEEIANVSVIYVDSQPKYNDYRSAFSLAEIKDGSTAITIKSGHSMTRSASDFTARIKALY